jgi:hypothetical protein
MTKAMEKQIEALSVAPQRDWIAGTKPSPVLISSEGNIFWGYPNNRVGRRAAEHKYGHKITPIATLTSEQREKLVSGEERIGGGTGVTYYVDFVNGNDANNGLSPDATTANTNKPWKTMTKALGAAGATSGDTIYLAPGSFRETVAMAATPASTMTVLADPGNEQGFKTSAGVLVAAGPVIHTAHLTNDKTAPNGGQLFGDAGKGFLTIKGIMFVGGTGLMMGITGSNVIIQDCAFIQGAGIYGRIFQFSSAFATNHNITIDRCLFFCYYTGATGSHLNLTASLGTGADYDVGFTVKNSCFQGWGGSTIQVASTGTGANKGGGFKFLNNTICGQVNFTGSTVSLTVPSYAYNNLMINGGAGSAGAFSGGTTGQLIEDYNLIYSQTARTSGTMNAGAHSIVNNYAPLFHFGQAGIWGMQPRPWGEPMAGSPLLGFGNDGSQTSYDGYNRPRPAGSGSSALPGIGWLERGNTWAQQLTTLHGAAPAGLVVTGPGYIDYEVEVDAVAQSISVWMQFDSTYDATGTSKPTLEVLANGECGVSAATQTMTAVANTWQQLTLNFTPTAKGIVTIRLRSLDANGGGKVYASDKAGW